MDCSWVSLEGLILFVFKNMRGKRINQFFSVVLLSFSLFSLACSGKLSRNSHTQQSDLVVSAFDQTDFYSRWTVEAQSSELLFHKDTLEVISQGGFTLWWNERISGDVTIEFYASVMDEGKPFDRLSDLNCFWMATDPLYPDDIFVRKEWRNGDFAKYYSLNLYYVGYGGNENTTTRFRKYFGDYDAFNNERIRPAIIKEYQDPQYLLIPNYWHHVRIVSTDKRVQYYADGQLLFDYADDEAYTSGWFGFRTVESRVKLHSFTIKQ